MSFKYNEKIRNLQPYSVMGGDYKVRLDANESFIPLPDDIKDEIIKALGDISFNRYPCSRAEKLCRAAASVYGVGFDNIAAGNGSDELIQIIISGFAQKGDTVLVLSPDFAMYSFYAQISELNTVCVSKDRLLSINVDELMNTIKEIDPRIVILSNPCNPTGQILSSHDIERISSCFDGLAVIDEAYMDFSREEESILKKCCERDNVIVLKTCSKAYGMAALRLGFCISCKKNIDAVLAVKSPYNVNSLTQAAGCVLLHHGDYLKECMETIIDSAQKLSENISALGFSVLPTHTNFCVIKSEKAEDIYNHLLQDAILVRKFDGFLRITTGSPAENALLLKSLADFLKKI